MRAGQPNPPNDSEPSESDSLSGSRPDFRPQQSSGPQVRAPLAGAVPALDAIDALVRPADLYEALPGGRVRCYACAHRCRISPGGRGVCQVRYNAEGTLWAPWGYVAALQSDPTEKKPFFHVHPGSDTLTFGMLGCDMHCPYCQNWDISQALRDTEAGRPPQRISAGDLVDLALRAGAQCVASSYNEPLITSEWSREIFEQASSQGLTCLYISNGNATRRVLEYLRPVTAGYKVDLKSMSSSAYRQLGAVLDHILEGIRIVHEMGFWLEVVTLIVPTFNDSAAELQDAARFIRSLSPDIPWHVTAFHQDYRMLDPANTTARALIRAAEIGYAEGLNYVYAGNLPGQVGRYENTYCPDCQALLIERFGYLIGDYRLTPEGKCPDCQARVAGIWPADPASVRVHQARGRRHGTIRARPGQL